jgi:hypothetical protein
VTLLTDLDAFITEHQRCGELDAGVEGFVVWIACAGRAWRGGWTRRTTQQARIELRTPRPSTQC